MSLRYPIPSQSRSGARHGEFVSGGEYEIKALVSSMFYNRLDKRDVKRFLDNTIKEIRNLASAVSNPLMATRIALGAFIDVITEKYERSVERYEKLLSEGVPKNVEIENIMNRLPSEIEELRKKVNKINLPRDITSEIITGIEDLYVEASLLDELTRVLEKVKDAAVKIARREKITWREAIALSLVYDFSVISPLVYPKSIEIPPVKPLKKYAEKLAKYAWKPRYMIITKRFARFNDFSFLIGFILDEEVNLPSDLKGIGIYLEEVGEDEIDRITKKGLRIVVTREGFKVEGVESESSLRFYFEEEPWLKPVTVERVMQLEKDYAILKYTKNTVRILEKMPRVAIASTGGVVVNECKNKCYVIPPRILGVKTVENRIGNVLTATVSWDAWGPFIEVMKRSSTGYLILADRKDLHPVSLVFRDKSGVKGFATPEVISTKRVNADSIREVNFVKVKPKPYLEEFIDAFTWPVEILHPPVLLTHDGHLIITTDRLIYLTPEKARINKPVKVNQYLLRQLYGPLYLGLVPVEPGTDEESVKLAEKGVRVYELLRRARKVGTYEFKNPPYDVDWGKIPGSVEYMLYELQTMLRFKGRVKINTYHYEENGVSADIVEAVISRNVRILSARFHK